MKPLKDMTTDEIRDELAAISEREARLKRQGRIVDLMADQNLYFQLIDEMAQRGVYSPAPEPLPFDELPDDDRDKLNHLIELAEIITTFNPDDYAIEEHAIYIRSWARIANMIINKHSATASDNPSS